MRKAFQSQPYKFGLMSQEKIQQQINMRMLILYNHQNSQDAVMMPCCAGSACDECGRNGILESEGNKVSRYFNKIYFDLFTKVRETMHYGASP